MAITTASQVEQDQRAKHGESEYNRREAVTKELSRQYGHWLNKRGKPKDQGFDKSKLTLEPLIDDDLPPEALSEREIAEDPVLSNAAFGRHTFYGSRFTQLYLALDIPQAETFLGFPFWRMEYVIGKMVERGHMI